MLDFPLRRMRSFSIMTCFSDPAINDALRMLTGYLRPTPMYNFPILAGIKPAELRRKGVMLSLAKGSWSLDICSTQHSPADRVGMHRITNRDTHFYPPHNSSVHLTTTSEVRRSVWITAMECGVVGQHNENRHFHPRHRPSWNDPPKNSVGPTYPPPHQSRTFPLLLAQLGYCVLCGL